MNPLYEVTVTWVSSAPKNPWAWCGGLAKADILLLVTQLAHDGRPVSIVALEFEELVAVFGRIVVMRD